MAGLIAYDLRKEASPNGLQLLRDGRVLRVAEMIVRVAIKSIQKQTTADADPIFPSCNKIKNKKHGSGTFAVAG